MTADPSKFLALGRGRYLLRLLERSSLKETAADLRPFMLREEGSGVDECPGEKCDVCAAFGETRAPRFMVNVRRADGTTGVASIGANTMRRLRKMASETPRHILSDASLVVQRAGWPRSMTIGRLLGRLQHAEDFDFGPTPSTGLSPRKWEAYRLNMLPPDPRCATCRELGRGPHGIGCL